MSSINSRSEATGRRFGRPPGGDSEVTRKQLLDAAKVVFAQRGYKEASNKRIADAAGVTSGAIYHYFPNKQAMFLAVHEDMQEHVLGRLEPLIEKATSLSGALRSVLHFLADARNLDLHSSAFFSVVRTEARRNPEISAALNDDRWLRIYNRLALLGIKTGEIEPENFRCFKAVLALCLLGITQHGTESSLSAHLAALDGLERLTFGRLVKVAEPEM